MNHQDHSDMARLGNSGDKWVCGSLSITADSSEDPLVAARDYPDPAWRNELWGWEKRSSVVSAFKALRSGKDSPGTVAHTCNPSILGGQGRKIA